MKKLAFVLFVAMLGLGMTSLAFALPWTKVQVGAGDSHPGSFSTFERVKIVFTTVTAVDTLDLTWDEDTVNDGDVVKVKLPGQGVPVYVSEPIDQTYSGLTVNGKGKIKLKIVGKGGDGAVFSATLSGPSPDATGGVGEDNQGGATHASEPASILLLGSGLSGMVAVGRRKFFKK